MRVKKKIEGTHKWLKCSHEASFCFHLFCWGFTKLLCSRVESRSDENFDRDKDKIRTERKIWKEEEKIHLAECHDGFVLSPLYGIYYTEAVMSVGSGFEAYTIVMCRDEDENYEFLQKF